MSEVDQAQCLLNTKFAGQFIALPVDKIKLALKVYEDKMTSATVAGRNKGNIQYIEAGMCRLYMTEILGISEEEISKTIKRAETRVKNIRKRAE